MIVLITRFSWQPRTLGGAEASADIYAYALKELGHDVRLITNFKTSRFEQVKILPLPGHRNLQQIAAWFVLPWLALFSNADIISAQSRSDQVVFTLTKWLHRKPVVWRDAGDLIHQISLNRKNPLARFNQHLLIAAMKKADAITVLNDDDKLALTKILANLGINISSRPYTVPSDILFEDYDLSAKPLPKPKEVLLGTYGRLDKHKGVQYVINTLQSLDNTKLWIIGDGLYRQELEKLASGLPVRFWSYQKNISKLLKSIDIFIQPSEFEGWGRTVKEAMYFGKPVIGSNTGGIAVQIEDGKTGLLFEPGNVKELTEKLELLINDKALREKLGKAARKKAIKDGDYVQLVKTKVLPLFEEVIKQRK